MNFRKIPYFLLVFIFSPLLNASQYLSVAVMVPASGFMTLETAYHQNYFDGIKHTGIDPQKYHMTLVELQIKAQKNIDTATEQLIRNAAKECMHNAAKKEFIKIDHHHAITLPFSHIELLKNKIVGVFETNKMIEDLIHTIQYNFQQDATMQEFIQAGIIQSIKPAHAEFIPHVSLATINRPHDKIGHRIKPKTMVSPFKISKDQCNVTAFWKRTPGLKKGPTIAGVLKASFGLAAIAAAAYWLCNYFGF